MSCRVFFFFFAFLFSSRGPCLLWPNLAEAQISSSFYLGRISWMNYGITISAFESNGLQLNMVRSDKFAGATPMVVTVYGGEFAEDRLLCEENSIALLSNSFVLPFSFTAHSNLHFCRNYALPWLLFWVLWMITIWELMWVRSLNSSSYKISIEFS